MEDVNYLVEKFSGSVVYAFAMCQRQGWFMYHGMLPDQHNAKLSEGRNVHLFTKKARGHREYHLDGMKFDRVEKHGKHIYVYEIKNSNKGYKAARMQMLFYLYKLSMKGINAIGVIEIPRQRKRYYIKLESSSMEELVRYLHAMEEVLVGSSPPPLEDNRYCKYCGYKMLCYS